MYECMGDMVEAGARTWWAPRLFRGGRGGRRDASRQADFARTAGHTFFLVPGYGAQGGNAEMLKNCFDENGLGGIVNNSRGILCAYRKNGGTYALAARAACVAMQKDLLSVLGEICAK